MNSGYHVRLFPALEAMAEKVGLRLSKSTMTMVALGSNYKLMNMEIPVSASIRQMMAAAFQWPLMTEGEMASA